MPLYRKNINLYVDSNSCLVSTLEWNTATPHEMVLTIGVDQPDAIQWVFGTDLILNLHRKDVQPDNSGDIVISMTDVCYSFHLKGAGGMSATLYASMYAVDMLLKAVQTEYADACVQWENAVQSEKFDEELSNWLSK